MSSMDGADVQLVHIDKMAPGQIRIWRQGPTWFAEVEVPGQSPVSGRGSFPYLALSSVRFQLEGLPKVAEEVPDGR